MLVEPSEEASQPSQTAFGYDLPSGWKSYGDGNKSSGMTVTNLDRGQSSFIKLELFRPGANMQKEIEDSEENIPTLDLGDLSICKTDLYVTIRYRQERPSAQKTTRARRAPRSRRAAGRGAARASEEGGDDGGKSDAFDLVSLDYNCSVVWSPPLSASFQPGVKSCCPSGSRHPSNTLRDPVQDGSEAEFSLVDGQIATTRCILEPHPTMEGLKTEIVAVRFQVSDCKQRRNCAITFFGFSLTLVFMLYLVGTSRGRITAILLASIQRRYVRPKRAGTTKRFRSNENSVFRFKVFRR